MKIKLAGIIIEIENQYNEIVERCRDYLADENEIPDMTIRITEDERAYVKQFHLNEGETVSDGFAEFDFIRQKYGRKLHLFDAIMLHACLVEMDGMGHAFCALSGGGKSTHAKMWVKAFGDKVKIIDGDNPIVRFENSRPMAYGTPCCGKEGWNINKKVPLKAVCFIVKSDHNKLTKLPPHIALMNIFGFGVPYRTSENEEKILELCEKLIEKVDFYKMECTISPDAALTAYQGMNGGIKNEDQ